MDLSWEKLLTQERNIGTMEPDVAKEKSHPLIHPHQRDLDRVMSTSAFRRLQGKAQVYILPDSDFVRTRLTHTLEVVNIARLLTLATLRNLQRCDLADEINEVQDKNNIESKDIVEIVATSACAHDIGNSPFGHIGEYAIRSWFETRSNRYEFLAKIPHNQKTPDATTGCISDFTKFDGNPQGFRVVNKLQGWPSKYGGLQLTYATLATMIKYPTFCNGNNKWGFYQREKTIANKVFEKTGLKENDTFIRHPLSYLMEASDDIAYSMSDLEDGVKMGLLDFSSVEAIFREKTPDAEGNIHDVFLNQNDVTDSKYTLTRNDPTNKLKFLRSAATVKLVEMCAESFVNNYDDLMKGKFKFKDLISANDKSKHFVEHSAKELTKRHIHFNERKVGKDTAAYRIVHNIMDEFSQMIEEYLCKGTKFNDKNRNLMMLMNPAYKDSDDNESFTKEPYEAYLRLVDFVSGMTDAHAKRIGERISGKL